jgi:hypothetical protein
MATRALVGFIQDGPKLISTYNHYDGYPENLGVALDKFYSMPEEALKIASTGYISYLNPETGEVESKHKESADVTSLSNNFEEAMYEVAKQADSYGADYVYIYDVEALDWKHVKMYGARQTTEQLMKELSELDGGIFGPSLDEGKKIEEGELDKVLSQVSFKLQDQPKHMVKAYMDSLANDIRLNGKETYADYSVEDFVEDYDNYIADKMAMEESTKNTWQHRAGIKK